MAMTVLICGDRNWHSKARILTRLSKLPQSTRIIHGACRGADCLAGECAEELGLDTKPYPAEWSKYRAAAGPIRNKQMLDMEEPELVIAFHENLTKSKGTSNMLNQASKRGIKIEVIE